MEALKITVGIIASLAIVIVVLFALIFKGVKKAKSKNISKVTKVSGNTSLLIDGLGGTNNIISATPSLSKIKVELNNTKIIDLQKIKEAGASGVVEGSKSVTIIMGSVSESISKLINDQISK